MGKLPTAAVHGIWVGALAGIAAQAWGLEPAKPANHAASEMELLDSNVDGFVSTDEHATGTKRMFRKLDANQDGKVTLAEMQVADTHLPGRVAIEPGQHAGKPLDARSKITAMDSDGDDMLSAAEYELHAEEIFKRLDANEDGRLTVEELQVAHQAITQE